MWDFFEHDLNTTPQKKFHARQTLINKPLAGSSGCRHSNGNTRFLGKKVIINFGLHGFSLCFQGAFADKLTKIIDFYIRFDQRSEKPF